MDVRDDPQVPGAHAGRCRSGLLANQAESPGDRSVVVDECSRGSLERLRSLARQYEGQADTVGTVADRSLRLTAVSASEPLRMRLASALAELHTVAGWCAFDSRADDRAGHHFRLAVELAASAGDAYRRSQALRHAGAMLDQGGHHNDALKCYQMGQIGLYDAHGEEPRAWLHMVSARALAHMDRPDLAASELAAARDGWQPPTPATGGSRRTRSSKPIWIMSPPRCNCAWAGSTARSTSL